MTAIRVDTRMIGPGHPCFIIAEAGVNHNGDLALAEQLVDAAAEAGADAVKFQTFSAERLATATAPKAAYQLATTAREESQREMLRKLELSPEAHRRLLERARRRGIVFLSTPFDEQSADLLEALGVPLFKIPSGEITNLPFLQHVARKGRPIILSTGMSFQQEVADAVKAIQDAGCDALILLHCTSTYPAEPETCNLRAMDTMRQTFGLPIGYSDHTRGIEIAIAAVSLGASVIEKHFTLSKSLPGSDHQASLEPNELKALVQAIRSVEKAMGDGIKRPTPPELETSAVVRKSIVAVTDLPAGTVLQKQHVAFKRPGTGISPAEVSRIIGRTLVKPISADELFSWEYLA